MTTTTKKKTFYNGQTAEKRRQTKAAILKATVLRKEQIKKLNGLLIYPIKELNELAEKVLKSEYPLELYLEQSKKLSEHIKKCLE